MTLKNQSARPIGIAPITDSVSVTPIVTAKLIARSFIGHDIAISSSVRQIAAERKYRFGLDRTVHARLTGQARARAHRQMPAQRELFCRAHRSQVVLARFDDDATGPAQRA